MIKNTKNEIINEMLKIKTDKMFISILASENKSLYENNDIIENILKNETENIFFSFLVQTNNQEGI